MIINYIILMSRHHQKDTDLLWLYAPKANFNSLCNDCRNSQQFSCQLSLEVQWWPRNKQQKLWTDRFFCWPIRFILQAIGSLIDRLVSFTNRSVPDLAVYFWVATVLALTIGSIMTTLEPKREQSIKTLLVWGYIRNIKALYKDLKIPIEINDTVMLCLRATLLTKAETSSVSENRS